MRTDLASPYNWTDHRPDPESEDFRNVVAWLVAHGAPAPEVTYIPLDPTGFVLTGQDTPLPITMFKFAGYENLFDASLVLNSPGVVLVELGKQANMLNYVFVKPIPPKPVPDTPPQPTVSDPVHAQTGVLINGKHQYFVNPEDLSPNGTEYPGPEGPLVKLSFDTPWGLYQRWNPKDERSGSRSSSPAPASSAGGRRVTAEAGSPGSGESAEQRGRR